MPRGVGRPTLSPRPGGGGEKVSCGVDTGHPPHTGLALRGELLAMATKPVDSHRRDDAVVQVASTSVRDDVPHPEVVAESVSVHLLGEDLFWRAERVDRLELLGEMP